MITQVVTNWINPRNGITDPTVATWLAKRDEEDGKVDLLYEIFIRSEFSEYYDSLNAKALESQGVIDLGNIGLINQLKYDNWIEMFAKLKEVEPSFDSSILDSSITFNQGSLLTLMATSPGMIINDQFAVRDSSLNLPLLYQPGGAGTGSVGSTYLSQGKVVPAWIRTDYNILPYIYSSGFSNLHRFNEVLTAQPSNQFAGSQNGTKYLGWFFQTDANGNEIDTARNIIFNAYGVENFCDSEMQLLINQLNNSNFSNGDKIRNLSSIDILKNALANTVNRVDRESYNLIKAAVSARRSGELESIMSSPNKLRLQVSLNTSFAIDEATEFFCCVSSILLEIRRYNMGVNNLLPDNLFGRTQQSLGRNSNYLMFGDYDNTVNFDSKMIYNMTNQNKFTTIDGFTQQPGNAQDLCYAFTPDRVTMISGSGIYDFSKNDAATLWINALLVCWKAVKYYFEINQNIATRLCYWINSSNIAQYFTLTNYMNAWLNGGAIAPDNYLFNVGFNDVGVAQANVKQASDVTGTTYTGAVDNVPSPLIIRGNAVNNIPSLNGLTQNATGLYFDIVALCGLHYSNTTVNAVSVNNIAWGTGFKARWRVFQWISPVTNNGAYVDNLLLFNAMTPATFPSQGGQPASNFFTGQIQIPTDERAFASNQVLTGGNVTANTDPRWKANAFIPRIWNPYLSEILSAIFDNIDLTALVSFVDIQRYVAYVNILINAISNFLYSNANGFEYLRQQISFLNTSFENLQIVETDQVLLKTKFIIQQLNAMIGTRTLINVLPISEIKETEFSNTAFPTELPPVIGVNYNLSGVINYLNTLISMFNSILSGVQQSNSEGIAIDGYDTAFVNTDQPPTIKNLLSTIFALTEWIKSYIFYDSETTMDIIPQVNGEKNMAYYLAIIQKESASRGLFSLKYGTNSFFQRISLINTISLPNLWRYMRGMTEIIRSMILHYKKSINILDIATLSHYLLCVTDDIFWYFSQPGDIKITALQNYACEYTNGNPMNINVLGNRIVLATNKSIEFWDITNNPNDPFSPAYSSNVFNMQMLHNSQCIYQDEMYFMAKALESDSFGIYKLSKTGELEKISYPQIDEWLTKKLRLGLAEYNPPKINSNINVLSTSFMLNQEPFIAFDLNIIGEIKMSEYTGYESKYMNTSILIYNAEYKTFSNIPRMYFYCMPIRTYFERFSDRNGKLNNYYDFEKEQHGFSYIRIPNNNFRDLMKEKQINKKIKTIYFDVELADRKNNSDFDKAKPSVNPWEDFGKQVLDPNYPNPYRKINHKFRPVNRSLDDIIVPIHIRPQIGARNIVYQISNFGTAIDGSIRIQWNGNIKINKITYELE